MTPEQIEKLKREICPHLPRSYEGSIICSTIDLLALRGMLTEGWQPIETAPKDDTKILLGRYTKDIWYISLGRYKGGGLYTLIPTGFRKYDWATHWMPLPQPPKCGGE